MPDDVFGGLPAGRTLTLMRGSATFQQQGFASAGPFNRRTNECAKLSWRELSAGTEVKAE